MINVNPNIRKKYIIFACTVIVEWIATSKLLYCSLEAIGIAAARIRTSTYFIKCHDLLQQLKRAKLENILSNYKIMNCLIILI